MIDQIMMEVNDEPCNAGNLSKCRQGRCERGKNVLRAPVPGEDS
jgi:hypothetical protein